MKRREIKITECLPFHSNRFSGCPIMSWPVYEDTYCPYYGDWTQQDDWEENAKKPKFCKVEKVIIMEEA